MVWFNAISAQVATTETAAWLVEVPRYGRFAFTAKYAVQHAGRRFASNGDGSLNCATVTATAYVGSQGRAIDLVPRWVTTYSR